MPVISVNMTSPMPPKEKLDKVAAQITEIFVRELNKATQRVVISFNEIPASDFYFGGKSVQSIKEREQNERV